MNAEQLRASLLQMAIEGKLVPQLESEAAVESIADGLEEVPFVIPETWKWMKMKELFEFVDYRGKTPTKTSNGIRLMTASNVRKGYIDHKRVEYISEAEYMERQSRGISQKGDILFTTEAPLGNVALADLDVYSAGQRVITLQSKFGVNSLYVNFLLSPYFQRELLKNATGTTAQGIKAAKLKEIILPVPPVEEQRRIVVKLEELLPLVEEYGKAQEGLDKLNAELGAKLRTSVLNEAIQGKLVPQLDSEPAVESFADEPEDVPFAIPDNWRWVTLGSIGTSNIGLTYKPTDLGDGLQGVPVLRSNNIQKGKLVLDDLKRVVMKNVPNKVLVHTGDLLICARNGSKALVGKAALIPSEAESFAFGAFMAVYRSCYNAYLYYFLQSPLFRKHLDAVNTTTINQITQKNLLSTLCPLPPVEEQRRIVQKLEILLSEVDKLVL